MNNMRFEFTTIAQAALKGDSSLASLIVAGRNAEELTWSVAPGELPREIGGWKYGPATPFQRQHIVDLIGRMMKLRWSRYDDFLLTLPSPEDDAGERLHRKWQHRRLFPGVGGGWLDLVDAAMELAEEADAGDWNMSDCKEKYGTLRMYHSSAAASAVMDAAEHLSGHICETCGAPGRNRSDSGWYMTRCDEHAETRR